MNGFWQDDDAVVIACFFALLIVVGLALIAVGA